VSRRARQAAAAALAGIVVYVLIDVALVFLRPRFSVLHSAESDYGSSGHDAWVMDVNFLLRMLISLAVVWALRAAVGGRVRLGAGPGLLAAWAVASGLLAFFPDDPAGTRLQTAGRIHVALAAIAFLAVLVGTFMTTRRLRADARFTPVVRPLFGLVGLGTLALALLLHAGLRGHSLGALWEKTFLAAMLAWLALSAAWIVRLGAA
jgi:hypothetical membrane protein